MISNLALVPREDPTARVRNAVSPIHPLEPTIFHERWWLDIVTRGMCRFAEVSENGKVVARLPYMLTRKMGRASAELPQLTHFLGPAIIDGEGKENKRFLRRMDLTRELIRQLPSTSYFYIKCHRDVKDVLAFQIQGFRSSVQFTHEIPAQAIEAVWTGMRDKGRNGIRLARQFVTLDPDVSAAEFIEFYHSNIEDRGESNHLDMTIVADIVTAALSRNRGALFCARDQSGSIASAIFCVWDGTTYYYLLSTRTKGSHRGAVSLLLWEAISDAMAKGLIFDFDGICNEGSARLAANFPTTITPRYIVTHESRFRRLWHAAKDVFNSDATSSSKMF